MDERGDKWLALWGGVTPELAENMERELAAEVAPGHPLPGADRPAWRPTFHRVEYDTGLVSAAFRTSGMLAEAGPMAHLYLATVLNGEPWASDFGYWLKSQPTATRDDIAGAVDEYLQSHGPEHWAFG